MYKKLITALLMAIILTVTLVSADVADTQTDFTQTEIAKSSVSISKCNITVSGKYVYTGKSVYASVKVTYGSKTLKKGTDYKLTYKNTVGPGKATVTITGKGSYTGSVAKSYYIKKQQSITGVQGSYFKKINDSSFQLSPKANTAITYKSNNPKVVSVSAKGLVTIKGSGKTTIVLTARETDKYFSTVKNVTITVSKYSQTITGVASSYTKTVLTTDFAIKATAKTSISYKSSNSKILTIDNTGKITINSAGSAVITVTAAESAIYAKATKQINVTIIKETQAITGVKLSYEKNTVSKDFTLKPEAKTKFEYDSSNVKVATISAKGVVKITGKGTTYLKIKAVESNIYKSAQKQVLLTVKKATKKQKCTRAREDACDWAIKIAKNNKFHYGYGKHAHHHGCYFCKNQGLKKGHGIKEYQYTYCCNPFVTAAWVHGGHCAKSCKTFKINLANDGSSHGIANRCNGAWKNISKPAYSKLIAGDVLLTPSHAMLYIGNKKIAQATGGDNNKKGSSSWNKSIRVNSYSKSSYKRVTRVWRYYGTGKY